MTYSTNHRARFDYEILETFEAGLVLQGWEVAAIRAGRVRLDGTHVVIRGGEAFLLNMTISPLQPKNTPKHAEQDRVRKLLLSRKQLDRLEKESEQVGLTIIPLSLYNRNRQVKLAIALVRGKKKADKREAIKKRDVARDIDRTLKSQ